MESFLMSFASMLIALAIVLAVAWLVLRLMRSRMQPGALLGLGGAKGEAGGRADDSLRFVRALPLGPKERVVLVEHRGARWLLGVTAGGISTVAHWPAEVAGSAAPAAAHVGVDAQRP